MATVKLTLDRRQSNITKGGKYPLVLRIGHRSKTRDIGFNLHLKEDQFNSETGKITGVRNAVRHTKRVRKVFSDVDLWMDENQGALKNREIDSVKVEIEQKFFRKTQSRTILSYAAIYLSRLRKEKRFSTASSYEDALKALIKYRLYLKKKDDRVLIKSLFEVNNKELIVLDEFKSLDIEIKAMDYSFLREFKSYMSNRFKSRNTPAIHLRSLQAIMNDAGKSFPELESHKPLSRIKKQSYENPPAPLDIHEIEAIRKLELKPESQIWHNRNYLLFMFNNMGMNFYDMAMLKGAQYGRRRVKYFRKKTIEEGDFFSVYQNDEAYQIIKYYLREVMYDDDYIFPIIPKGTPAERLYKVNNAKVKTFNKYAKKLAGLAGINKKITSYTLRDTWTNIGLDLGIDIRKISSGLGHSSVQVTEKHYGKSVTEKILDQVNAKITKSY